MDYPFTIKPKISTVGSIIEFSRQEPIISFLPDDCKRNLLGFNASTIYEECNHLLIRLRFYHLIIFFLECNIAQGMIFKSKRSGIFQNFTVDVDPVYKYIKKLRGGVQWFMLDIKCFVSSISFKLKNETNN